MPSLFRIFAITAVAVATLTGATATTNNPRAVVTNDVRAADPNAAVHDILQDLIMGVDTCTRQMTPGLLQIIIGLNSAFKPVVDCVGSKVKEATTKVQEISGKDNVPVFYPNMQSDTQLTAQALKVVKNAANRVIPFVGNMVEIPVILPGFQLLDALLQFADGRLEATAPGVTSGQDLVQVVSSVVS